MIYNQEGESGEMTGAVYPAGYLCHCECINCRSTLSVFFFVRLVTCESVSSSIIMSGRANTTEFSGCIPESWVPDHGNTTSNTLPKAVSQPGSIWKQQLVT